MTRYLSLLTFTDQGIRDVKQTITRAEAFQGAVEAAGGKVLSQYWAVGDADGCVIFEAPDDSTASALLLSLGHKCNVRTKSMRVYDAKEFESVLKKA